MGFIFNKFILLKIFVLGYVMTAIEMLLQYKFLMSTYISNDWIDFIYNPPKNVLNDDIEYHIISATLGDTNVMTRLLLYMHSTELHTIDDIKILYPQWYDSCETLNIKFRELDESHIKEVNINFQAKVDEISGRHMQLGEIILQ